MKKHKISQRKLGSDLKYSALLSIFLSYAPKAKTPDALASGVPIRLGGDLLSHGNIPHYHRHNSVSLLSSVWNQVGPPHYRRQKSVDDILLFLSYLFLFISLSSSN